MTDWPALNPREASSEPEAPGQLDLSLTGDAPRRARRLVNDVLLDWDRGDADLIHSAQLVATELVTNAMQHGGDFLVLELGRDEDALIVGVRDGTAVLPRPHEAEDEDEQGRGLTIVVALAEDWGVETTGDGGKRVWAKLPLRGTDS